MFAIDSGGITTGRAEVLVVLRHADVFQILRHAVARDGRVEIGRSRQIAAAFVVQPAVAGQRARDLAHAVGAEVEADAGIVVANRGQGLPTVVGTDKRDDEFVGHFLVVGIFHALHGIGLLAAFGVGEDHRVVGLRDALPATVAVHGVVASVDRRDLAAVVLAHLLLQLLEVSRAVGGQRVAAVHEGVHEDAVHAVLLRHLQQRVEMRLLRMHAAVGKQSEQMQPPLAGARMLHGIEQHGMREEFAVLDHQIDARDVHVHDAPRADVEVPDFAVAHLPFGQSDERPAGVNERVGILAQQPVVGRLARERDGVGFGFGTVSPAVEDDENERFRTGHK